MKLKISLFIIHYFFRKGSDLLAYAPKDARSRYEHGVYQEFFGHDGQGIMNYVLIQAKDNETMIRVEHLNEAVKVCFFFVILTIFLF